MIDCNEASSNIYSVYHDWLGRRLNVNVVQEISFSHAKLPISPQLKLNICLMAAMASYIFINNEIGRD